MNDKPSYLSLLNAIAVGAGRGHAVLRAWRDATADEGLAAVLNLVAIREQEHAAAFSKRLYELGYRVRQSPSREFDESLALAASDAPDAEKFRRIAGVCEPHADPLGRVFDDPSIDAETGALLGRFIAEERDSERRLRRLWQSPQDRPERSRGGVDAATLAELAARMDRLSLTLKELRQLEH